MTQKRPQDPPRGREAETIGRPDAEDRTLQVLEWSQIQEALRARCRSAPAERRALALRPSSDPVKIRVMLAETAEGLALLEQGKTAPSGAVRDLEPVREALSTQAVLETEPLLDVASVLQAIHDARRSLAEAAETAPRLATLAKGLVELPDLVREIRRCIDSSGEVSDAASPELARARSRVATLARQVKERIRKVASDPELEDVLQERYFTVREGRYVVPVRQEARSALRGIVHGRSSSGASYFIEPESVVEANNDYAVAQADEREEVLRILRNLTAKVRENLERILAGYEILVHLDLVWAKALLAKDMAAHIPGEGEEGELELPSARHPMLALREAETVVPNDLRLGEDGFFLIVTGPNTGGKTVAMKTAGLAVLMARAGLAVPSTKKARLAFFPKVLADLGDEQSLEEHLSSFSGHLHRVQEILAECGPGTLVLLDEVVSGTDPREGAALARALLERIADKGARGIVTTHYQELKGIAAEDTRFRNVGMEFDLDTLQPTFRMIYDIPGRSSALAVARRLGLDSAIVTRAEELHGLQGASLERLLDEMEELRAEIERERAEAARVRGEMERLEREREREIERLRRKDREYLGEEEARLGEALAQARDEARRIAKRLSSETDAAKVEEARRRLKEIERESKERLRAAQPSGCQTPPADLENLQEGQRVWLRRYNKQATVLGPAGEKGVPVSVGAVRMTVPLAELEASKGTSRRATTSSVAARASGGEPEEEIPFTAQLRSNTLDLRGLTVDEALARVDAFLDESLRKRTSPVILIHGHGTGALRKAVRSHLEDSPYVVGKRPGKRGEGEDGVTVVALIRG